MRNRPSAARHALLAAALALTAVPAAPLPAAAAAAVPPVPAAIGLLAPGALTPATIASTCAAQIKTARQTIDAIVHRRSARTFASVVVPLENANSDLGDNLAVQTFLFNVSPDPAIRAASEQCGADLSNFGSQQSARPDVYAALIAARASNTARTPADRKLLALTIVNAQRAGAGLAAAQRKQFIALEAKLTDLSNAFAANLANDKSAITITADQLKPLPPDFAATLTTDASGATTVPVNESTYGTFLTSETDAAARKAFYIAYNQRGGKKNVDLLEQALVARAEVAHLLGFRNWSAYISADRMAGNPARIMTFLTSLDTALLPKARTERAELSTAKGAPVDQWDVAFYQNQLRKSRYSVDRNVVKTYFPAPHVIDVVLHIYSTLLGITFAPAPELPKWDPSVMAYDVTDTKTGAFRGSFYLDLYPRPGKFNHFENAPLTERRIDASGRVHAAYNTILGNWPLPAPGEPSLLSHDDVITFFHEFGHNVAALLADTPYETLNGGFRWDFVEAPSQMLENFVWQPSILKMISANVDTGEPLPDDLIAKMISARYFDEATVEVGQAFYAITDQRYHTLPPPVDTTAVWKAGVAQFTPSAFIEGTYPQAAFNHLMNGYEAQYYGYLWSKVYAQDMFTAFSSGGLLNPAVGARYRSDILAPARLIEPDAEVRAFLGRPMDPRTFYRQIGVPVKS